MSLLYTHKVVANMLFKQNEYRGINFTALFQLMRLVAQTNANENVVLISAIQLGSRVYSIRQVDLSSHTIL